MTFRDVAPYVTNIVYIKLKVFISTVIMRCRLYYWHVPIGTKSKFVGLTLIKKHYTAKIRIGNSCTFRSSPDSNTIGIKQPCFLSASKEGVVSIGSNCGLSGTVIAATKSICIGNRVMFGANVTVTDGDRHSLNAAQRFFGEQGSSAPISIGDDVWIGMNSVILKGVTIGEGAVIAANSLVNKDIPAYTIAAGTPAKITNKKSQQV